jgi:hypothetical protein
MGGLLGTLFKNAVSKLVFTALGVAIFIGYVSLTGGGGGDGYTEVKELPPVVFDGGGGILELEINLNEPGELHASFSQYDEEGDQEAGLHVRRELDAGSHHFRVDVADDTYGYFEASIPEPDVGAELEWTIKLDGQYLTREEMKLDEPLDPRYAFFVQLEFDQISQLAEWFHAD